MCLSMVFIDAGEVMAEVEAKMAADAIEMPEPTMRDPVSVAVVVTPTLAKPGDVVEVVVKTKILPGWRIYRYAPPTSAYMTTKWLLELPEGVEKSGDWQKPPPEYLPGYSDILVHQGESVFSHKVKIPEGAKTGQLFTIKAGLNYQTCNNDMCLRPTIKVMDLVVTVQ